MVYQHPLAYLLAVEGAALLQAFAGEHDRAFTLARIAEVRALLDAAPVWGDGVTLPSVPTPDGYRTWAETYDQPGNQLVDLEQPVVREIVRDLPVGVALDVACGTGRHTRYLAELGHRVIGVDSAPAMLDRAAGSVPDAGAPGPIPLTRGSSRTTPSTSSCAPWRSPMCRTSAPP